MDEDDETVEKLPVRVGDDFFGSLNPEDRIALVKIDVENDELLVLRGLRKTLSTHHPIVLFENYRAEGPAGGKAVFAFLRSIGYQHFYAVERRAKHVPAACRSRADDRAVRRRALTSGSTRYRA